MVTSAMIKKLKDLNAISDKDNINDIVGVLEQGNISDDMFLEAVETEIEKGKKLLEIVKGNHHGGSSNLFHFIKKENIKDLVLALSDISVTLILINQAKVIEALTEEVNENSSPMFAMAQESIVQDLYRVTIALSEEKNYCIKKGVEHKFSIGKDAAFEDFMRGKTT